MDAKRFAMVLGIMVLLPLFIGLFFDAIYEAPKYETFCNESRLVKAEPAMPEKCLASPTEMRCTAGKVNADGSQMFNCDSLVSQKKCADIYSTEEVRTCTGNNGNPITSTDDDCCQVFESCDYCSRDFQEAEKVYNRNLFFILAPVGLLAIIIGIFWSVEYLGAGFMFGGLVTLFYATIRYFSDMSKLLRAIVIFVELMIIIYLGLKKIGPGRESPKVEPKKAPGKKR